VGGWNQIVWGVVLIATLVVLAGVYGWRQVRLLRRLRAGTELSADEARWRRGQAWRRLVGSGMMIVLAGLLAVALVLNNRSAEQIYAAGREAFLVWSAAWIAVLLALMALVLLAALDLWSTRRFTVQQLRRLQDERRAVIQEEIDRRRRERNGHS
jgi:hypothetical protein